MSWETVAYRSTGHYEPLWSFPNLEAGRWNRPNSWPAQYLSLHPMTPWAEQLRTLDMRTEEQARTTRIPIWSLRVRLDVEPLVIGFADAGDHYLDAADLVADDHSACQALAANLHASGVTSIRVPSAALPGTFNLVVLEPRLGDIGYHEEPLAIEDTPAAMLAQDGHCPAGLWDLAHYRGSPVPHAALDAHLNEDEFPFVQPEVTSASLWVSS